MSIAQDKLFTQSSHDSAFVCFSNDDMSFEDMQCSQLMFPYGDWRDLCSASAKTRSYDASCFGVQSQTVSDKTFAWGDSRKDFDSMDMQQSDMSEDASSHSSPTEFKKIFVCERVNRSSTYTNRRDVINKTIIRHFHKYLRLAFSDIISNKKSSFTIDSMKTQIIDMLVHFKFAKEEAKEIEEITEFILWIIFQNKRMKSKKNLSEVLRKYFAAVGEDRFESIQIMADILKGYGHTKLQRLFENKVLRIVFKRLLEVESDNFLSQVPTEKRAKAVEALRDFKTNININN